MKFKRVDKIPPSGSGSNGRWGKNSLQIITLAENMKPGEVVEITDIPYKSSHVFVVRIKDIFLRKGWYDKFVLSERSGIVYLKKKVEEK